LIIWKKNSIQSIILRSSIFNVTSGTSIQLDGKTIQDKIVDLLTIDPRIGNENQFSNFIKNFNRKSFILNCKCLDMHIIIDLPISTTFDPNSYSWYGPNRTFQRK
jgi:hypothetical protein